MKKSTKVEYNGKVDYEEWANAVYLSGFSYSVYELERDFRLSRSYINNVLLKNIYYVVYASKYAYKLKNGLKCRVYVRKEDVYNWIQEKGTFSVQTELIDLYSYLHSYPKIANKALLIYRNNKTTKRQERNGTLPKELFDYLKNELVIYNVDKNWSNRKRNNIKSIKIGGFDISKKLVYYPKDFEVREKAYREAFNNGDTKIKIGNQITMFVHKNNVKMKIPYLIPYGKTIYIKKK